MPYISELKLKNAAWINVQKISKPRLESLAKKYNLLREDILDVLPPTERSKLIIRQNYLFMILLFPVYNRGEGALRAEEINFFISPKFLLTVHNNKIPVIKNLFDLHKKKAADSDTASLLYGIIAALQNYCFPILRHINANIEEVEKILFKKDNKRSTLEEILRIKTNIFDFERSVQPHEYILNKLPKTADSFLSLNLLEKNFTGLIENAKEIQLDLIGYKDAINALHEANATLVEYRINQIIKTLTIFAVITFPLTLFATLFAMQAKDTPIIGTPNDFWKIVGIILSAALMMLLLFRWRRWI